MTTEPARKPPRLTPAERLATIAENTRRSPIVQMERDILLRQIVLVQRAGTLSATEREFLPTILDQLKAGIHLSAAQAYRLDRILNRTTVQRSG